MTKRIKIASIIMSVVLFSVLVAGIGMTAAIWAGLGGSTGIAPQAPVGDWNTWAKYFKYEKVSDTTIALTGYSGTNLEDVIIPSEIDGFTVTEVRNTVFASTTLKSVAVTLKVPPSVLKIETSAFSAMPNLQTVVFADKTDWAIGETNRCEIGDFAFSGCTGLKTVTVEGTRNVIFASTAFLGCASLTSVSGADLSGFII